MTKFSWGVQLVCLAALGSLLVYTLTLVRLGRLSARVTVSWILADLVAVAALLLWGRLPVIGYTSTLGDRELLVVLAVLFFSYLAFLMLDSLQRISGQSAQIARLAQQIALLQEAAAAPAARPVQAPPAGPSDERREPGPRPEPAAPLQQPQPGALGQIVLAVWLILCFGTYLVPGLRQPACPTAQPDAGQLQAMTNVFWFVAPVLVLSLASVGAGVLCLRPARTLTTALPRWLVLPLEYFVGQGVLTTLLLGLGLSGHFVAGWLVPPIGVLAIVGAVSLAARWRDSLADAGRAWRAWLGASLAWKIVAVATAGIFLYGFTSVAGALWVDSPAFYMAMSRLIAGTGRLTALPGYNSFSAIGLFGELHMAALFTLGMSGTTPRVLSWVAFIPTIAVVYGLSRVCGLGRRGAVITVAAAVSTSSIASLWGGGKADLFAIGPALAACVIIVSLWDRDRLGPAPFLAGLLFGYAALSKVSYIVAFLPALTILMVWQRAHVRRPQGLIALAAAALPIGLAFSAGFLLAFGQNLLKNQVILGAPFAFFGSEPFFSAKTVRRLLLTYPLVVTYGRYWGQMGTLSPIVLGFLPLVVFYLRWPARWLDSRLLAVSLAATAGLAAWIVLFPSIITMRYIQATLLLFAIPAAAAAEIATRRSTLLSLLVPAGVLAAIVATPRHTAIVVPTFSSARATLAAIAGPPHACKGSSPYEADCLAHVAINQLAKPGDRVLGLSYLRFWLDPGLLQIMSSANEVNHVLYCAGGPCPRDDFWARYRDAQPGYRFILHDDVSHPTAASVFGDPPADIELRQLFSSGPISAWEVRRRPAAD